MSLFFVLNRAALGLPDIIELIRLNIPIIFTCANDYADVKVSHAVLKYYTCFLESILHVFPRITTWHSHT